MKNPPIIDPLMVEPPSAVLASRRVAVLAGDGLDEKQLEAIRRALEIDGAQVHVVSNRSGALQGMAGGQVPVDHHWLDMPSVMFDAVYIPGGSDSVATVQADPDGLHFMREAYEHGKSVAATGQGVELLKEVGVPLPVDLDDMGTTGVVTDQHEQPLAQVAEQFIAAIIKDRHWRRNEEIDCAVDVSSVLALPGGHQGSVGLGPM